MTIKQPAGPHPIPWLTTSEWAEVQLSVNQICSSLGEKAVQIQELVQNIQHNYVDIDSRMEQLCADTCIDCQQVCCRTATVWYDLRDLLYIKLADGVIPERQVHRGGDFSCVNLGKNGCLIPRNRRPFICTWYICADQKVVLASLESGGSYGRLSLLIAETQESRKRLERLCIDIVCS